jgi:hypothetical protein
MESKVSQKYLQLLKKKITIQQLDEAVGKILYKIWKLVCLLILFEFCNEANEKR